jgi:hypothetical protein
LLRLAYRARLPRIVARSISCPRTLGFQVYSFSGESELPEQVASIRSFLRHAGAPARFTVVSDGTHTSEAIELLERLHRVVEVRPLGGIVRTDLPPEVMSYATDHPLGKKLSMLLSLEVSAPTIYVDSDILFFEGASDLADGRYLSGENYYLPDCRPSLDEALIDDVRTLETPVNSGFLILNRALDWTDALARLRHAPSPAGFFTEQTVVHLALHADGGLPLDPNSYVVGVQDQFRFRDGYTRTRPALRHYTRPVRYRLWSNLRPAGAW